MISINQAVAQGITRLRMPRWAPTDAYLLLSIIDGKVGLWCKLYSRTEQQAIGEPTPQLFLSYNVADSGDCEAYEPYTGEKDVKDTAP